MHSNHCLTQSGCGKWQPLNHHQRHRAKVALQTGLRHWGPIQLFLENRERERHPKHDFKSNIPPLMRRARTLVRRMLAYILTTEHSSQLCRFPHPVKQPWQEGRTALLWWEWSLPDSLSSAPQLRNSLFIHESPNGFNKWQPSSLNPYKENWAARSSKGEKETMGGLQVSAILVCTSLRHWDIDCARSENTCNMETVIDTRIMDETQKST